MALEIVSLPERHPNVAFLVAYGTSAYVRLALDPRKLPDGTIHRPVAINWLRRLGSGVAENTSRDIGWANLPQFVLDSSVTWTDTKNAHTINEEGAIGIIGLLIHDLENTRIQRVVPIGGGGDYYLELQDGAETQVECSGIRIDENGYETPSRLGKKSKQVWPVRKKM